MGDARFMNVRIGDAERTESIELLTRHFNAGRLTPAEHEERREKAKIAIIRSEIEVLFDDLPAPHPDMSAALPPVVSEAEQAAARKTPMSEFWSILAGLLILFGIPAVIVLGTTLGLWWLFGPLAVGVILAFVLEEASMKPKRLQD
ncbi:DUF1707 domain-containing protein [Actinocrispum sp. NPDC049592]|uniref:DUF1707 SHOCT-like domain-containing protein n=1 Tax=Actinocrispum sp. NPDC049592 TaxID=3154835 RepID=UPI003422A990